jgi:hypothetical protein
VPAISRASSKAGLKKLAKKQWLSGGRNLLRAGLEELDMQKITLDCPGRRVFLEREQEAVIALRDAEQKADGIPFTQLAAFLGFQAARLQHEDICPRCRAELAAA